MKRLLLLLASTVFAALVCQIAYTANCPDVRCIQFSILWDDQDDADPVRCLFYETGQQRPIHTNKTELSGTWGCSQSLIKRMTWTECLDCECSRAEPDIGDTRCGRVNGEEEVLEYVYKCYCDSSQITW